jgi:DNA invertase Pin-like site-specific DNA recombinase
MGKRVETMANIKYIRVSTTKQNTARQEVDTATYDKVFIEKVSGKDRERPELKKMMAYIREGDTVTVERKASTRKNWNNWQKRSPAKWN